MLDEADAVTRTGELDVEPGLEMEMDCAHAAGTAKSASINERQEPIRILKGYPLLIGLLIGGSP